VSVGNHTLSARYSGDGTYATVYERSSRGNGDKSTSLVWNLGSESKNDQLESLTAQMP
jgi:hypothetical protein